MVEKLNTLQELQEGVVDKTIQVLELRNETWDFLKASHTVDQAQEQLAEVREYSKSVANLGISILNFSASNPSQTDAIASLMASFGRLNGYALDIQNNLSQDIDQKQRDRESKKVDFVKNATFIFGIPAAFVAGVKNGIGHGQIGADEAMYIGFAVSVPIVFQKSIRKMFRGAVRAMNTISVNEIAKHYKMDAQIGFALAAKSVNDNVNRFGGRARAGINRLMKIGGPKP